MAGKRHRDRGLSTSRGWRVGLLDGVLGNASKTDASQANAEYAQLLGPGEQIEHAYQLVRDMFLFTNFRLILVDKQGITGKKVEYSRFHIRASFASLSKRPARSTSMQSSSCGPRDVHSAAEAVQQVGERLRAPGAADAVCVLRVVTTKTSWP